MNTQTVTRELLTPSHFTLVPPSSFLTRAGHAPDVGPHRRGTPLSSSTSRALAVTAQPSDGTRSGGDEQSTVRYVSPDRTVHAPPKAELETVDSIQANLAKVSGVGGRVDASEVHGIAERPPVESQRLPKPVATKHAPSKGEAFAVGPNRDGKRLSLPNARSREEEERMLLAWVPKTPKHTGKNPSPTHSSSKRAQTQEQTSLPLRANPAIISGSSKESYKPRSVQAEDDLGEVTDNTEASLARSLAQCQKIDKSLEFYAGIREKWSENAQPPAPQAANRKEVVHPEAPLQRKDAASIVQGHKGRNTDVHVETAPSSAKDSAWTYSARVGVSGTPTETKPRRKRLSGKEKASKHQGVQLEPARVTRHPRKVSEVPTTVGKTAGVRVIERSQRRHKPRQQEPNTTGKAFKQPLNDLDVSPELKRKAGSTPTPIPATLHSVSGTAPQTVSVCASSPSLEAERVSQIKLELSDNSAPAPHTASQAEEEEEEEFNDFDSVLPENEVESVEPLSGTFGKPVLTGAQPIHPTPPLPTITPSPLTKGQSAESEIVREKPRRAETKNDTTLARILQAEEESRAGVSLQHAHITTDTSSDLEIARQIQQEFSQHAGGGVRVARASEGGASVAAEGHGEPRTMTKSNFESFRFLSDDPTYFDHGYELGREFIVNDHNSPMLEQQEKNRNIPRKSVKKNNYTSKWDNEYRYRGFDERGYRNLSSERSQPYERKQWAQVGGTGIMTGCVRDMTRSDQILDREEQDLAFEGRQDLEEIESGLDAQIITRISHVYNYKTKHRPKDASVDPVTQCLVCLDDFHEGEPLRLMPCAHTFHRACIDKWLEENLNCPVCKNDMVLLAREMGVKVDRDKYKRRYW